MRCHVGASLASVGFRSRRLDTRRRVLHAQLLPLLRSLRRNLPTAADFARDARLGVALLAPLGRALAARPSARAPLPLRARAARQKLSRTPPRLPPALGRASRRVPSRRMAPARRGLPSARLDLDGLQLSNLLQPPDRLHVLRHDPPRRLRHQLLPSAPAGGTENLTPRSRARARAVGDNAGAASGPQDATPTALPLQHAQLHLHAPRRRR